MIDGIPGRSAPRLDEIRGGLRRWGRQCGEVRSTAYVPADFGLQYLARVSAYGTSGTLVGSAFGTPPMAVTADEAPGHAIPLGCVVADHGARTCAKHTGTSDV